MFFTDIVLVWSHVSWPANWLQRSSHMALIVGKMMSILLSFQRWRNFKAWAFCIIYSVDITVHCACNICFFSKWIFSISGRYDSNIKNVILFAACLFVLLSVHIMRETRRPWAAKHNNTGQNTRAKTDPTMNQKKKTALEKTQRDFRKPNYICSIKTHIIIYYIIIIPT